MSCNVAQCNAVVTGDVTAGLERCALCKLMSSNERTNERTNEHGIAESSAQYYAGRLRDAGAARWPGQGLGYPGTWVLRSLQGLWYHAADQILGISSRSGVQPTYHTVQPYQELHNTVQCIQCRDDSTAATLIATLWRRTDTR